MPLAYHSGQNAPGPVSPLPASVDTTWAEKRGIRAQRYYGSDGSEWDIGDFRSGVFLMPGVVGLTPGPYKQQVQEAGHHGQMFMGGRHDALDVLWPIHLYHDGTDEDWLYRYDQWWDSFTYRPYSTDQYGVWEVTGPNNETRRLRLRLVDSGEESEQDPSMLGWSSFKMRLVADVPFWTGDVESTPWMSSASEARSFFDPEAGGVLYLDTEHTVENVRLVNPGDIEAWPTWVLKGPWTTAKLGVRSAEIEIPFPGNRGDTLVIDSQYATATMNGIDRTGDLARWEFEAIPPGWDIPLSVELTGFGAVQCSITPHYWRAIGRKGRGKADDA